MIKLLFFIVLSLSSYSAIGQTQVSIDTLETEDLELLDVKEEYSLDGFEVNSKEATGLKKSEIFINKIGRAHV